MSGICGFLCKEKQLAFDAILKMSTAIRHRGKYGEGYAFLNNGRIELVSDSDRFISSKQDFLSAPPKLNTSLCLGFRDSSMNSSSSTFHQPVYNKRNESCITFDGVIYNAASIRNELMQGGYELAGTMDAEVILAGYEHWGIGIINRLNGMFAIALYDHHLKKLWLVRDHLGIKPLFYSETPDGVVWGSEIKSILQNPLVPHRLFEAGLIANYYLGATPEPYTCFEHIFSVPAAQYIEINLNDFSIRKNEYWSFNLNQKKERYTITDAAAELEDRLINSIRLTLNTDFPVISMMSGGIDSTTITAIAHQMRPSLSCYSFAIDGSGKELDELPQAINLAKTLKIQQIVQHLKPEDLIPELDSNIRHFEAPYSSAESNLLPAKMLSEMGYWAILSGNGADEIFGGAGYYLKIALWQKLRHFGFMRYFIPPVGSFLPRVRNVLDINSIRKYYANTRLAMRPYQITQLVPGASKDILDEIINWLLPTNGGDKSNLLEILFQLEIKHSFAAHHAFRDGLSAAKYGIEFRYPFLDHTLVEWIYSLPLELRYADTTTKPLLRKVAGKYILKENLSMPKKGFGLPTLPFWHSVPALRDYMEINLSKLKKRNIYHNKVIDRWIKNPQNEFELAKIWQLVTTQVWMEEYLD